MSEAVDFNQMIREAAGRQPVPPGSAEPAEVVEPVGSIGIGRGRGADAASRVGESDLINEHLRTALAVVRGRVPLDHVFANL